MTTNTNTKTEVREVGELILNFLVRTYPTNKEGKCISQELLDKMSDEELSKQIDIFSDVEGKGQAVQETDA